MPTINIEAQQYTSSKSGGNDEMGASQRRTQDKASVLLIELQQPQCLV